MDAVRCALKWRAAIETSVPAAVMQERFRDTGQPGGLKLRNYLAPVRAAIAETSQEVPWHRGSRCQPAGLWNWCLQKNNLKESFCAM